MDDVTANLLLRLLATSPTDFRRLVWTVRFRNSTEVLVPSAAVERWERDDGAKL